jgi:heterodisulfide reductase subunit B
VGSPEVAEGCARRILDSARAGGAEALATTCPLCAFNLDHRQAEMKERDASFRTMPVLYITQVLGVALGIPPERLGFERNFVDPRPVLEARDLLATGTCR